LRVPFGRLRAQTGDDLLVGDVLHGLDCGFELI
jgi:hypothetical protein